MWDTGFVGMEAILFFLSASNGLYSNLDFHVCLCFYSLWLNYLFSYHHQPPTLSPISSSLLKSRSVDKTTAATQCALIWELQFCSCMLLSIAATHQPDNNKAMWFLEIWRPPVSRLCVVWVGAHAAWGDGTDNSCASTGNVTNFPSLTFSHIHICPLLSHFVCLWLHWAPTCDVLQSKRNLCVLAHAVCLCICLWTNHSCDI